MRAPLTTTSPSGPPAEEGDTFYDNCIEALKVVIFLEGLTDRYKEYDDHLANAFAENNGIYPKCAPTTKERIVRHKPSAATPSSTMYAGDPIALSTFLRYPFFPG